MKKMLSLLLALVMALSLAACGASGSGSTPAQNSSSGNTGSTSGPADTGETGALKIGLDIYDTTDATAGPMYKNCLTACEAMGAELVVATDGLDLETEITNIENLIQSGCQAVFCLPYSDDAIPRIVKICEDAGVYFGFYWYDLTEEETRNACYNSEYFIANVYEDDVWSAYTAMQTLNEAGASKIGMFGLPTGRTTTDKRDSGLDQACEEFNMEILVEDRVNTGTSDDAASAVESMVSAYPDLDGIVIAGMTQTCLPGVVQALKNLGLEGQVKVSCIDFNENQNEYFEDELINGVIGGHFTGAAWLAVLTINQLQGTPLVNEPVSVKDEFIVLQSGDDAQNYTEYLYNELPYTTDEFAQMSQKINPDFTYEKLQEIIAAYSIDDVMTRHGY